MDSKRFDRLFSRAITRLRKGGLSKGQYARNEKGIGVVPTAQDAVSFCAIGCLWRGVGGPAHPDLEVALIALERYVREVWGVAPSNRGLKIVFETIIMDWNDKASTTVKDVIAAYEHIRSNGVEYAKVIW